MAIPSVCRDLSTCGFFRANGARPAAWPVSASFRPLAVHKYGFGAKSCATRLNPPGSAPLAGAKEAACVTLMSSRRFLRAFASGPVRRASASLSASRLDSHPLANTPSAPQSRLTAGQSKKKLREEPAGKPSVEL